MLRPAVIITLIFLGILSFVAHTLISTGFFRTIEPKFDGRILKEIPLVGAEDITVSVKDSFAIISSTDRSHDRLEDKGGLYWMDLRNGDFEPVLLTGEFDQPFAPHGISLYQKDSSYLIMAISHSLRGHSLDLFELREQKLRYIRTYDDPAIVHPNDVVMVNESQFYFTNDHRYVEGFGRLIEEYAGAAWCNVIFYDGTDYREVASGIAYANGINMDFERELLYVASPRGFLVKVYQYQENGELTFVEDIDAGTGVDNIEFDPQGNLWIGSHPDLLHFAAYAKGKKEYSPSEIIRINYRGKKDFTIDQIYVEDGSTMSASTVAAPFGNQLLVGNVTDDRFLVLERN